MVNGTYAWINYCPFCSKIVRGGYDLKDVREAIAGRVCSICGDEIDVAGRAYCSTACARIAGVDVGNLPDEVFNDPF